MFVLEPLKIHYVKEIARKIDLAPTSVKKHLQSLTEQNLIVRKKGERFIGFLANRDSESFLFYKKITNLIMLRRSGLVDCLVDSIHPKAIVIYGSYLRGEDIEQSDVDLFILSDVKKPLALDKYEQALKRRIHILIEKNLNILPKELRKEIINGMVLHGYLKNG